MSNILAFDIETIPSQQPLTSAQQEEYNRCFEAVVKKRYPTLSYEEVLKTYMTPSENEDIKNLVMSVNPYLGEIVCIGLIVQTSAGEERTKALTGKEFDILTEFWNIIDKRDLLYVSFNGIAFDVPFIVKRSMYYKIPVSNRNFINLKRYSRYPHFDVKLQINDFDKFAGGKLNLLCDHLKIPSPKEGEIKADQVYTAYKNGQLNLIAEYCLRDVKATLDVYKEISDYVY